MGSTQGRSTMLSAIDISKRFDGAVALDHVSFELERGEIHALAGENGAGKSTLMKILAGVHTSFEGQLRLHGQSVRFSGVRDAQAAGIAIIHQELNLVAHLSIAENIFLGRAPTRFGGLLVDQSACRCATRALLRRLDLSLDPDTPVKQLRVGEQQLVEIAKALSLDARILIMDEPTAALTQAECSRLFAVMRQLAASGVAIIYISHRLDEVLSLADRVTVLRDGRKVCTRARREVTEEAIVTAMVGRPLLALSHPRCARSQVALSVRNLSLVRPNAASKRAVVKDVDFELRCGEVLGIAGLLGSGRTEILETLFGATSGQIAGRIELYGEPVRLRSPAHAVRCGIAMVNEDRKAKGLHLDSSLAANVVLAVLGRLARLGLRDFAAEAALAQDTVQRLGIRGDRGEPVRLLSGGNQQKVAIGKWLVLRPRLLLLDEPTRGIDVGAKREIYELIFRLARGGMPIIVVSSELPELIALSDRILVMAQGRQCGLLERADCSEENILRLAMPRGHASTEGTAA